MLLAGVAGRLPSAGRTESTCTSLRTDAVRHEPPVRPIERTPGIRRRLVMSDRHLPVRPNLEQLKHQAKDLLRAMQRGDPEALAELRARHPEQIDASRSQAGRRAARAGPQLRRGELAPARARLPDDRCDLSRRCGGGARRWCCGIRNCSPKTRVACKGNWGPPMSYAANLGRDRHHHDAPWPRRDRPAVRVRPGVPPGRDRNRAAVARGWAPDPWPAS